MIRTRKRRVLSLSKWQHRGGGEVCGLWLPCLHCNFFITTITELTSACEVTTLWRYTNLFIIIIITAKGWNWKRRGW